MAAAASRSPPSLLVHSSPPCHVRTPYSSSCCFHSGPQTSLSKLSTSSPAARITRWPRLSRIGFKVVRSAAIVTCGGGVPEINESQFSDAVLKSDRPVLVEFVANWCGPCRLISPAMESIAQEYGDKLTVVKIDHDLNPRLIEEYKVYGLPTLIFFKNGQEIPESRREGAITKTKLQEYVDSLLQSMSVA